MRRNWTKLQPEIRTTCENLAKMRIGVAAFMMFLPIRAAASFISGGFAAFIEAAFSPLTLAMLVIIIGSSALLIKRAEQVAPRAVQDYLEILPEDAKAIRRIYGEHGPADVFSPWIRTAPGVLNRLLRGVAGRFNPLPKP